MDTRSVSRTDGQSSVRSDRQHENSIPSHKHSLQGGRWGGGEGCGGIITINANLFWFVCLTFIHVHGKQGRSWQDGDIPTTMYEAVNPYFVYIVSPLTDNYSS